MRSRMMRNVAVACAMALASALSCVPGFAQQPAPQQAASQQATWGAVRVAEQAVTVRHKPDPASPVVRTLKPGDKVRLDFVQSNGWAALFDVSETQRDQNRAIGYAEAWLFAASSQTQNATQPAKPVAKPAQETKAEAKTEPKTAHSPELKSEVKQQPGLLSGQAPSSGKQEPVRITSDKMVYSQTENAVIFLGNVHATQDDMALWGNKVTAYFSDKNKGKDQKGQKDAKDHADKGAADKSPGDFGDKIERIVAEGSVRLVVGKNEGACNQLTYFVADGVLRMEGNPILREGQNTVRGDIVKFYIRENRSEVLSGAQRRVEAIFYSPKDGK